MVSTTRSDPRRQEKGNGGFSAASISFTNYLKPFLSPTAGRLLGESGKTMVALCGSKGKADLPEAVALRDTGGKSLRPVVLPDCRAKARAAKEAFPLS